MSTQTATLAGGCFWCTEAIFKRLKGVKSVTSGYAGGEVEAIQIKFNPSIISYKKLLEVFFKTHDPTQLNRQGPDVGPQYRSAIFYHTDQQRRTAEEVKKEMSGAYKDPIVTEIVPFNNFYEAEAYHKDFYSRNRDYAYCRLIIDPKIEKLAKEFKGEVKG